MNPQPNFSELCRIPENGRNLEWEIQFLQCLPTALLTVEAETPILGPDGFSYLFVSQKVNSKEPADKIPKWLASAGVGLIVNGEKMPPDYVLNFGSIWFFEKTGSLVAPASLRPDAEVELNFQKLKQGNPSESFFPSSARQFLREFIQAHDKNLRPRLVLLTEDEQDFDLGFSLQSLGNPPPHEHVGLAEAIAWFLPPHYSVLLLSEEAPLVFHDL